MCSFRLWEPTSLRGFRWPSGHTWNSFVINSGWVRLPPCQWSIVALRATKWLIKKVWANFTFCFDIFIAIFSKQANIRCSIGSISRPISSRDHNATDQAIVKGRYQSFYRKLDNFFSGKQQTAVRTDQKIYSLLIYYFYMVVRIFKVATSLSTFLINWLSQSLWKVKQYSFARVSPSKVWFAKVVLTKLEV